MSEQPPRSPYGPAYGGAPGEPPPSGLSNKAKFWIGVAVALPAMAVAGIISGAGSAVVDALGGDPAVGAAVSGAIALALLAGFVTMIVLARTRWIALGILAGSAIVLILAAGVCVALLVAYSNNYG